MEQNATNAAKRTIPAEYYTTLKLRPKAHDYSVIEALCENSGTLSVKDANLDTFLHLAVQKKDFALVQFLLQNGALVNLPNRKSDSPLHLAVRNNDLNCIWLLLLHGADPHRKNSLPMSPFVTAVVLPINSSPLIDAFIAAGVSINEQTLQECRAAAEFAQKTLHTSSAVKEKTQKHLNRAVKQVEHHVNEISKWQVAFKSSLMTGESTFLTPNWLENKLRHPVLNQISLQRVNILIDMVDNIELPRENRKSLLDNLQLVLDSLIDEINTARAGIESLRSLLMTLPKLSQVGLDMGSLSQPLFLCKAKALTDLSQKVKSKLQMMLIEHKLKNGIDKLSSSEIEELLVASDLKECLRFFKEKKMTAADIWKLDECQLKSISLPQIKRFMFVQRTLKEKRTFVLPNKPILPLVKRLLKIFQKDFVNQLQTCGITLEEEAIMLTEEDLTHGQLSVASSDNRAQILTLLTEAKRKHFNHLDKSAQSSTAVPPSFCCPISYELMRDPVMTCDGQTYERSMIELWLTVNDTSPLTNQKLSSKIIIPNIALKNAIQEFSSNMSKV